MTDKLFHVTNDEALISNVYFSPEFSDLRIRGKKKWIINEKSKKALEDSIKRGKTVSVDAGSGNNVAFNSLEVGG